MISIIIPTLNEEENIEKLLRSLEMLEGEGEKEIIVADGGSRDQTPVLAARWAREVISCPQGRARQMNRGAEAARGDILLFLHADTQLPPSALKAMEEVMKNSKAAGGWFSHALDSSKFIFRLISFGINVRTRLTRVAVGEQALFVRASIFQAMGGYTDIPLMEDIEFTKRLKQYGRTVQLNTRIVTSVRRWQTKGVWRTILLMWSLRLLYFMGVSPQRLHKWYYGE
jgi:rSAM/selenodomain-associated transferase 2